MAPAVPSFIFRSPPEEVEPVAAIEDAAPEGKKSPRAPRPILGLQPWEKVGGAEGALSTKSRVQQLQAIRARGKIRQLTGEIGTTPLPTKVVEDEPQIPEIEDVPAKSPSPDLEPVVEPSLEEKLAAIKAKCASGLAESAQSGQLRSAFRQHKVAKSKAPAKPNYPKPEDARAPRKAHGLGTWAPIRASNSESCSVAYYKEQLEAIKKHGTKNAARLIGPPGAYEETEKPKKPKVKKPPAVADEATTTASPAPLPPLKVSPALKNKQAGVRRTPRPHNGPELSAEYGRVEQLRFLRATGCSKSALHCPPKDALAQTH
jgi:hypothetical protein